MELLSLKMAFGAFFFTLLRVSFTRGNLPQQANIHIKEEYIPSHDYAILRTFVDKIKTRISFGEDVAVYKWVNGEPILDKIREKFVLDNVKKSARQLNKPYRKDDELFFIDLMEATKFIEYALVSDWYAKESEGNTPAGSVSLDETRKKISAMQNELINLYFSLKDLQHSDNCQKLLAKAIFETENNNDLLLRAVQRAFGNYCKKQIDHKSVNHYHQF